MLFLFSWCLVIYNNFCIPFCIYVPSFEKYLRFLAHASIWSSVFLLSNGNFHHFIEITFCTSSILEIFVKKSIDCNLIFRIPIVFQASIWILAQFFYVQWQTELDQDDDKLKSKKKLGYLAYLILIFSSYRVKEDKNGERGD